MTAWLWLCGFYSISVLFGLLHWASPPPPPPLQTLLQHHHCDKTLILWYNTVWPPCHCWTFDLLRRWSPRDFTTTTTATVLAGPLTSANLFRRRWLREPPWSPLLSATRSVHSSLLPASHCSVLYCRPLRAPPGPLPGWLLLSIYYLAYLVLFN